MLIIIVVLTFFRDVDGELMFTSRTCGKVTVCSEPIITLVTDNYAVISYFEVEAAVWTGILLTYIPSLRLSRRQPPEPYIPILK
jgi:hypothetical protein